MYLRFQQIFSFSPRSTTILYRSVSTMPHYMDSRLLHVLISSPTLVITHILYALLPRDPWADWLAAANIVITHQIHLAFYGAAHFAVATDDQLQYSIWVADHRRRLPGWRQVVHRLIRTPRLYLYLFLFLTTSILLLARMWSVIALYLPHNLPPELPFECHNATAPYCAAHLPCPASVLYISPLAEAWAVNWGGRESPFIPHKNSNVTIQPLAAVAASATSIFTTAVAALVRSKHRTRINTADYILAHDTSQDFVFRPDLDGFFCDRRFFLNSLMIDIERHLHFHVVSGEQAELAAGTFILNIDKLRLSRQGNWWERTAIHYPLLSCFPHYKLENWTTVAHYNLHAALDTSLWDMAHLTTLHSIAMSTNAAVAVAISAEVLRLEHAISAAGCARRHSSTCPDLFRQLDAVEAAKKEERLRALELYVVWEQMQVSVYALRILEDYLFTRMPVSALESEAVRTSLHRTLTSHVSTMVKRAGVLAGLHWAHNLSRIDGVDSMGSMLSPAEVSANEAACFRCWSRREVLERKWIDCKISTARAARGEGKVGFWKWLLGQVMPFDVDGCDALFDRGLALSFFFLPHPTSLSREQQQRMKPLGQDLRPMIPGRSIWKYDVEEEDKLYAWFDSKEGFFDWQYKYDQRQARIPMDSHLKSDWRWWKRNLIGEKCVDIGEHVLGELINAVAAEVRVPEKRWWSMRWPGQGDHEEQTHPPEHSWCLGWREVPREVGEDDGDTCNFWPEFLHRDFEGSYLL